MRAAGREATPDYSRGISPSPAGGGRRSRLRLLLLLGGLTGGGLLVAGDLSTLYEVDVLTVTKTSVSGHAQHGFALVVVGLAAVAMTLGAARGRRPAMLALGVLGVLALAIAAITGDFHDVHSAGVIGQLYESADATPKRGFYYETAGGVLLVIAGAGLLLVPPAGTAAPGRRRRGPRPPSGVAPDRARRRAAPATEASRRHRAETGISEQMAADGPG